MYIGIDIGTGSIKCALLASDGTVQTFGTPYSGVIRPGFQSMGDFEKSIRKALSRVGEEVKRRGEPIKGIAASGHGPSLAVIDPEGKPLGDMITWQENSATAEAVELSGLYDGFSKTGECWEAKVLRAWREAGKKNPGSTALFPKDYLLYLLTGRRVIDHSTAATLAFYQPLESGWRLPEELDPSFLPEVVESYHVARMTNGTFTADCGLPSGIPVFGGGIDAWCEALGGGAVEPGMLVDGSGTSTCVSRCCSGGETPLEHVIPGRSFRIETISSTGGSIRWAESVLGISVDEWKLGWEESGKDKRRTCPLPIIFLPYLSGERSPVWDEDAAALFLGMRKEDGAPHLMEAVHQGIAMAVEQCLRLITFGSDSPVRAVGGGAANLPLLKMKADLSGRTFQMMKEKDAAPVGAGILAAFGAGEGSVEELAERWNRVEREITPDPSTAVRWNSLFTVYDDMYEILERKMKNLADMRRAE